MEKKSEPKVEERRGAGVIQKLVDSSVQLIEDSLNVKGGDDNRSGIQVLKAIVNSDDKVTNSTNDNRGFQVQRPDESSSSVQNLNFEQNLNFQSVEVDNTQHLLPTETVELNLEGKGNYETSLVNLNLEAKGEEITDGLDFVSEFMQEEDNKVVENLEKYRTMVQTKKINSLDEPQNEPNKQYVQDNQTSSSYTFPIISYKPQPTHLISPTDGDEVLKLLESDTFTDTVYSLEDEQMFSNTQLLSEMEQFYKVHHNKLQKENKNILEYLDSQDYLEDVYGFLELVKKDRGINLIGEEKLKALNRLLMLKQHMEQLKPELE